MSLSDDQGWIVRTAVLLGTLRTAPRFAGPGSVEKLQHSLSLKPASRPLPVVPNLLPNLHQAVVAFCFIAVGGSFRVDDVYVDPYAKR